MTKIEIPINKSKLNFIGRGSMFNVKEGNTSAYWKDTTGKYMILIDCGGTVFKRIVELDLLDGVEEMIILITHTHSDHIGSLGDLIFYCAFCKPEIDVMVCCSILSAYSLKGYLNNTGVLATMQKRDNLKLIILQDSDTVSNSGLIFRSDNNKNLCAVNFIKDPTHIVQSTPECIADSISCGLLIQFTDKTIYYSGDTQRIPYCKLNMAYIDEIYVDCAVRTNSPQCTDKYPHYTLYDMYKDLKDISFPLDRVYAMHLDCDGVIEECDRFGINVVENI